MGFLRGLVTRNLFLKVASLGLAVLLWMVVRVESPERQSLPGVAVRVALQDPEWTLAEDPFPPSVQVVFNGPARELFRMAVDQPVINIPVDAVHAGDTVVVLRREWLRHNGQGIVIEDFQPSSVRLTFEPIRSLPIPVAPRSTGALPTGLALAAPLASDPSVIRVRGPQGRISALDSLRLTPLDLSGITRSGAFQTRVDTVGLSPVEVGATRVSVIVQVEDQIRREVPGIPVLPSGPGGGRILRVTPDTLTVILLGARSIVNSVETAALRVVFPGELVVDMAAGDSLRLPVRVEGSPPLVRARPAVDSVTVGWAPASSIDGGAW